MYVHFNYVHSGSPLSKEGLWQNWMSTSGSAQLENESYMANNHPPHSNGYHHCDNCDMGCDGAKKSDTDPSSNHSATG